MVEVQAEIINKIREFSVIARRSYNISKIVLYGSYARGTQNQYSDIDIAVILDDSNKGDIFDITKNLFMISLDIDSRIEPNCIFQNEIEELEPASITSEILRTGIEITIN